MSLGGSGGRATRELALREAASRIGRKAARELLLHVCQCAHAELIAHGERPLSEAECRAFGALVERAAAGEPMAYLLGSAWFAGLEFAVTPDVLIPRPDTETLVGRALSVLEGRVSPRVLDLGTGSGIVAVTLALGRPDAELSAVDVSPSALEVARGNARRHGVAVRFLLGDWFAPLAGEQFDLIVSNPPYIAAGDAHLGRDGLPYEPACALTDGVVGGEGMACIERIIAKAPEHLCPGGALWIEHGYDQAVKTRTLLQGAGFSAVASWRDEAGIERVSGGVWPGSGS